VSVESQFFNSIPCHYWKGFHNSKTPKEKGIPLILALLLPTKREAKRALVRLPFRLEVLKDGLEGFLEPFPAAKAAGNQTKPAFAGSTIGLGHEGGLCMVARVFRRREGFFRLFLEIPRQAREKSWTSVLKVRLRS